MATTATNNATVKQLKDQYKAAQYAYYHTGKDTMSDKDFDALEERITRLDPKFTRGTGILGKKSPVKLARFMPSLEKCKADSGALPRYLARIITYAPAFAPTSAVVMDKLDGASVLASYVKGKLTALATRGDGVTGKNITFLADFCRHLPKTSVTGGGAKYTGHVRMEAILPKKIYDKKYRAEADSARAAVSGALNRQDGSLMLRDIHFVALRALDKNIPMVAGLGMLHRMGFEVVEYRLLDYKTISETKLDAVLRNSKASSDYEMDGIVVHADCDELPKDADKPKFAFAYKRDTGADDAPLTTIEDIEWKVSAFGIVVPIGILKPVDFDGVTVKRVSLRNYEWARSRGCGIGAKVRIVRNGDIIPGIARVESKAALRKPTHLGALTFNGTDLVASSGNNMAEVLDRFFGHCELDGLGDAAAKALAADEITTVDVMGMTDATQWVPYVGNSVVLADKAAQEINRFRRTLTVEQLPAVMASCGVFDKGIGRTRIQSFIKVYGSKMLLNKTPVGEVRAFASEASGCGNVFSVNLAKGLPDWYRWLTASGLKFRKAAEATVMGTKMQGQVVSWTGYRSAEEEAWVREQGGTVAAFGSKTTILFHRPDGKASTKVEKAEAKGISVRVFPKKKGN